MEPYLEELKKKILKEYQDVNVLVYPANENNAIAFFQVAKKKCRIHLFEPCIMQRWDYIYNTEKCLYEFKPRNVNSYSHRCFGFNSKEILRIPIHPVDEQQCQILIDNEISRHLKTFVFSGFRNYRYNCYCNRYNPIKFLEDYMYRVSKDSLRMRFFTNLIDCDLIENASAYNAARDIALKSSSIKETFGISVKYLKVVGINHSEIAIKLRDLGFSPEQAKYLVTRVSFDYYQNKYINLLRFILSNRQLHISRYLTYFELLRSLDQEGIKHSFPKYPKDCTEERLDDLYNKANIISIRLRYIKGISKEIKEHYKNEVLPIAEQFNYKGRKYSIFACPALEELGVEGNVQSTCLAGYIDAVSEGREYIYFLRENDKLYESLYAIDVLPDKKVRQIHGYLNANLSKELYPLVKRWAKKYDLKLGYLDGRLCHV